MINENQSFFRSFSKKSFKVVLANWSLLVELSGDNCEPIEPDTSSKITAYIGLPSLYYPSLFDFKNKPRN